MYPFLSAGTVSQRAAILPVCSQSVQTNQRVHLCLPQVFPRAESHGHREGGYGQEVDKRLTDQDPERLFDGLDKETQSWTSRG